MALTLSAEQRLGRAGIIDFFENHQAAWQGAAKQSYEFLANSYPKGAQIRPDDVAKVLQPIVEVDADLRNELNRHKLTQKYWIADFTDLVIDRSWAKIEKRSQS